MTREERDQINQETRIELLESGCDKGVSYAKFFAGRRVVDVHLN